MTDFDQLIKEKANSAQYKYKASAWKHLASQAGFKVGLSGLQIALVSIAIVAVVGGAIFISNLQKTTPVPAPQQEISTSTAIDTTEPQPQPLIVKHPQSSQPSVAARPAQQADTITPPETGSPQEVVKKNKTLKSKQYIYHPIRINVDTITDDVPSDEQLRRCNSNL